MLRFILVESSRGRMVLISSDLKLNPIAAVEMYCRRVTIETLFDTLKNTLGAMGYHFWSQYLRSASRRFLRALENAAICLPWAFRASRWPTRSSRCATSRYLS